jgi:hypothetical protein
VRVTSCTPGLHDKQEILRYTEVQMVGWGVSPEFDLLKTAGKQRASQKNKNPFRPLGVSYPPANT